MIGILFGRLVALLAFAAGAAHEQLDRAARRLAGAPDSVDQHWAEMIAATGQRPQDWKPSSPAEREYVDALHRLIGLPHPDAIPTAWRGPTADGGKRITLTDVVDILVKHIPGNTVGAPGWAETVPLAVAAKTRRTYITFLDQPQTARELGDLAKTFYGDGPIFVAPGDGDDLAAVLDHRGLLLARRTA